MPVDCLNCSTATTDRARFCPRCGHPLKAGAHPPGRHAHCAVEVTQSVSAGQRARRREFEELLKAHEIDTVCGGAYSSPLSRTVLFLNDGFFTSPQFAVEVPVRDDLRPEGDPEAWFPDGQWAHIVIHVYKPKFLDSLVRLAAAYQQQSGKVARVVKDF